LEDIALAALPEIIVNPFAPPPPGSDDPHQGVDFADVDPTYQIALEGRPVQAVMEGTVAGVIGERFPYGNAVLVETPLERLPTPWLETLQIPPVVPLREGHPILTCPESASESIDLTGPRSIYLLYAHMKSPSPLNVGDTVTCGMPLGEIGQSGNALNPHLHLEMRVGPAGARFESMAHYTGNASSEEMANYCLWRVSGAFQVLDPMRLLSPGK
jgi:murein DD-endopeptidase MepM/ murein hydrolase activator NlpD